MARDDQPGEDGLSRDLEQILRSSWSKLESNVAGKLDIEAGLADVLATKPAPSIKPAPCIKPTPSMPYEDWLVSLLRFAYTKTGNQYDAENLLLEAMEEVFRSQSKRTESMSRAQLGRHVRFIIQDNSAERLKRVNFTGRPKDKTGAPVMDDAEIVPRAIDRAINQTPDYMHHALNLLFHRRMTVDEVAKTLGLNPDAMQEYLAMARNVGLHIEI
jgi:DNA-directed RNA polymerase specialized sigma24 family protein